MGLPAKSMLNAKYVRTYPLCDNDRPFNADSVKHLYVRNLMGYARALTHAQPIQNAYACKKRDTRDTRSHPTRHHRNPSDSLLTSRNASNHARKRFNGKGAVTSKFNMDFVAQDAPMCPAKTNLLLPDILTFVGFSALRAYFGPLPQRASTPRTDGRTD